MAEDNSDKNFDDMFNTYGKDLPKVRFRFKSYKSSNNIANQEIRSGSSTDVNLGNSQQPSRADMFVKLTSKLTPVAPTKLSSEQNDRNSENTDHSNGTNTASNGLQTTKEIHSFQNVKESKVIKLKFSTKKISVSNDLLNDNNMQNKLSNLKGKYTSNPFKSKSMNALLTKPSLRMANTSKTSDNVEPYRQSIPKKFVFKNTSKYSDLFDRLISDEEPSKSLVSNTSLDDISLKSKSNDNIAETNIGNDSFSASLSANTQMFEADERLAKLLQEEEQKNFEEQCAAAGSSYPSIEEDELLARLLDEEERRNSVNVPNGTSRTGEADQYSFNDSDWNSEWSDEFQNNSPATNILVPEAVRVDNTAEFQKVYPHTSLLNETLHTTFGLKEYRPAQEEIINASLQQHDCFVLMPTGGGKSLCYQLPAILTPGTTIVISPLRALISDQVDKLSALDIPSAHLCSNVSMADANVIYSKLHMREPGIKLLYLTPEKINASKSIADVLNSMYRRDKLARFVIDEAHCLSQWGHDFRPDYKLLASLRQLYPNVPIMCLTATATHLVQVDVTSILKLRNLKVFIRSFNRPNIKYVVLPKVGKNIVADIADLIKRKFLKKSGIIYCLCRLDCEVLANDLSFVGIQAKSYHAGMNDDLRETLQRDWMNDKFHVIVATIAFGMGIDKPDVRFVIHNSVPKSVEAFYQESGRAGRDGDISYSYLYYSYSDVIRLQRIIKLNSKDKATEGHFDNVEQMAAYCENKVDCRRYLQLVHLGEKFDRKTCIANKETICDNCENIDNYTSVDITKECRELAQLTKELSAKRKVTMLHVAEVYKGSRIKKIFTMNDDKLSLYGSGAHFAKTDIQRFLKELIFKKILSTFVSRNGDFPVAYIKDGTNYNTFFSDNEKITVPVNKSSWMPKESSEPEASTSASLCLPSTSKVPDYRISNLKIKCHEELLDVCRSLAMERNVTLSSVMNLSAIKVMAETLPNTKDDVLKIQYVTKAIFEKFGEKFMQVTTKYRFELEKLQLMNSDEQKEESDSDDIDVLRESFRKRKRKFQRLWKGRRRN